MENADGLFNNYVAARPAKDTIDKMLGIVSEAPTARNSLSAIQIREAVMKSSVGRNVIEDIDEEDISEEEVEFINLKKDIDSSFCSEDKLQLFYIFYFIINIIFYLCIRHLNSATSFFSHYTT